MIRYNGTHQVYGGFLRHGPPNHDVFGSWWHWIRRCKWKVRKSAADSALLKREFENQYHKYMFYINVFALCFTICTHIYTHMIIYMHMFVHIHVNIYLFISTYTCTCMCIHTYIYIYHILAYTFMHIILISHLPRLDQWIAACANGFQHCFALTGSTPKGQNYAKLKVAYRVDVRGSCLIIMENHHFW